MWTAGYATQPPSHAQGARGGLAMQTDGRAAHRCVAIVQPSGFGTCRRCGARQDCQRADNAQPRSVTWGAFRCRHGRREWLRTSRRAHDPKRALRAVGGWGSGLQHDLQCAYARPSDTPLPAAQCRNGTARWLDIQLGAPSLNAGGGWTGGVGRRCATALTLSQVRRSHSHPSHPENTPRRPSSIHRRPLCSGPTAVPQYLTVRTTRHSLRCTPHFFHTIYLQLVEPAAERRRCGAVAFLAGSHGGGPFHLLMDVQHPRCVPPASHAHAAFHTPLASSAEFSCLCAASTRSAPSDAARHRRAPPTGYAKPMHALTVCLTRALFPPLRWWVRLLRSALTHAPARPPHAARTMAYDINSRSKIHLNVGTIGTCSLRAIK